ncbi:hypothetical protein RND81_12G221000 [Saponaria officinalis]|uniref:FAR1 domain-containing protein n=1 Tax=Saponaria officinalis TaxID=3572 RepID=A0AAW1HE21_SAPOF
MGQNKGFEKDPEAEYCRNLTSEFTPYIGQEFFGDDEAVTFYKIYALACGLDVRKYTTKKWRDGEVRSKLLVCNREGFTYVAKGNSVENINEAEGGVQRAQKRNNKITRVGCKAQIRLFVKNGLLFIDRCHMGHNHELISVHDRQFQKMSRNIEDFRKYLIIYNSRISRTST